MNALVLTYHSHHMEGSTYAANDHVALHLDLRLIDKAGYQIVSLDKLVDAFLEEKNTGNASAGAQIGRRLIAITFDDGPEYDAIDFEHPTLGFQRSFLGILQDFSSSSGHSQRSHVSATSFVIASPTARRAMEQLADSGTYYLHQDALNDRWWSSAIDSGYIAIANHSWDHLHPGLSHVAHSRQARGDFTQVDNWADADTQILAATRYINEQTGGRAAPFFAYPFGQYNRFLTEEYFPNGSNGHGIRAAFTVDGRPLHPRENIWTLPRYSCGYNWSDPTDLLNLLNPA